MECARKKITLGTKELVSSNINIISGCSHDCRYCYAVRWQFDSKEKSKNPGKSWN